MKRKIAFFGTLIAMMFLLTVCGGGGGGGNVPQNNSGNTQTGSVSEETIAAALADLTPKIESLMTGQTKPSPADVIQSLAGTPNVRVLGTTPDGAVVAEIGVNGPHMVIPTLPLASGLYDPATDPINIAYPKPLPTNISASPVSSTIVNRGTAMAQSPTSVPSGARVLLMSALSSADFKDPTTEIKPIFTKEDRGYTSIDILPGTIDNLRKVKGYDVFFFKGHGVLYAKFSPYIDKSRAYQNYTITSVNEVDILHPSPPQYNVDINKYNIVFVYAPVAKGVFKWLYGITGDFVNEYWTFNDDSLVFMDACYSASTGSVSAEYFINTLFSKKVSTYLGWSSAIESDFADERAKLVFDRLLGANSVQPGLDPPQRPFDITALIKEMTDRKLKIWPGNSEYPPSELSFFYKDGFGLLAPSIKKMEVDEKAMRLTLTGIFGKQAGHTLKVTLAGTELPWKSWTEDTIVTELLPEQAGEVVVEINGRKSNPVKLTEWNMTLNYNSTTVAAGLGTTKKTMTFNVRFRADVHGYRELSGKKDPEYPTNIPFFAESTSTVTYKGSGSLHIIDHDNVLSGGGTITNVIQLSKELPPISGDYLGCEGYIDAKNKRLVLYLYGYGTQLIWSDGGDETVEAGTNDLYSFYSTGQNEWLDSVKGTAFVIPLDNNYAIQAGNAEMPETFGVTISLKWSLTSAQSPPADTDQR